MKYIQKKIVSELPKTVGSITDTLNVEDKSRNAPSINLVQTMAGVPTEGIIAYETEDGSIPEGYEEVENPNEIPVVTTTTNGLMSAGDKAKLDALDMSGVITKTFSINMSSANTWYDTGITGSDLYTGTYIVQMWCNFGGQANIWDEYYSGVMSWYHGGTNSTVANQIGLHNAGHAPNNGNIMLRTLRQSSGGHLKLQIASALAMSASRDVVLRFRRII